MTHVTTTVYRIAFHTFSTGRESGYPEVARGSHLTFEDPFTAALEASRLNEGEEPVMVDLTTREVALPYFVDPLEALDAEGYLQHRAAILQAEVDRMALREKADRRAARAAREQRQALAREAAALGREARQAADRG